VVRHDASFTSVSWIPSEAIPGLFKIPMVLGISHYDPPPPGRLDDLEALHAAGAFRFANPLRAWIEVDDGTVVDAGYEGHGLISSTVAKLGVTERAIPPVAFPDLRAEPEVGDGWVRFVQTTGGRTGAPMPRRVNRPPFMQITAPSVWTTLALTIRTDGSSEYEIVGASPFPRHWFYDGAGALVKKSGIADYKGWAGEMFGDRSPWGDYQHELKVADAESDLERCLSEVIMQGGRKPEIRRVAQGTDLVRQGEEGHELYLVLDGMLSVDIDGEAVAEVGPGTILGEMAVVEGGKRTATLRAETPVKVAVAQGDDLDRQTLVDLAAQHRGEGATDG
jgi:hypothetical protein